MHIYIYVYMRTTNFKEKMSFCITIDLQTWEGQDTETFERLLRRIEHIIELPDVFCVTISFHCVWNLTVKL